MRGAVWWDHSEECQRAEEWPLDESYSRERTTRTRPNENFCPCLRGGLHHYALLLLSFCLYVSR